MTGDAVAGLLYRNAADGDRVFLASEDGTTVTYAEQLDRSQRVAAGLRRRGARAGDRVHVQLGNCREFYDLWFATALSGTVLVPTNPQASAAELEHMLADARPVLSLTDPAAVGALLAEGDATGRSANDVSSAGDDGPRLAAIMYTSGTTSRAKGVMVTDANYVAVGEAVAAHLAVTAADRWLIALPLFHANAQYYCTMSALATGASVALAPRFSASGWGRQARATNATLGSLFAAPVRMILAQEPDPLDADNRLRAVLFAQNVTDEQAREFERRFGTELLQLYGMTETVLPPTMNPPGAARRWSSIGRPLPGLSIDLVRDDGEPATGPAGEMRIAGEPGVTVAAGYWNNPAATAGTFTPEGLRTGDLARRDPDGFYYFTDRSKDMIKRAGENVSASEIESVAAQHPDVAECAAIGVPDPVRDEAIWLIVVPRPGTAPAETDLLSWCRERLSPFKVPSAVEFAGTLPRTSVGKLRKSELRTLLASRAPQA
ncbi:MAG TPA: AMP-binding protein [Trebonia sp.]|nr:AMP-binding protein [Trebonia sp.]